MKKIPLNLNWIRSGAPAMPWSRTDEGICVSLPDDATIDLPRGKDAEAGAANGYFPDAYSIYTYYLAANESWRDKKVFLCFDGVYMNALVSFNDETAVQHPYGYSPFRADISSDIRYDMPNKISVTAYANTPSGRWYTGSGIYREASLLVGGPCYLDPDDLFITTPVADKDHGEIIVKGIVSTVAETAASAEVVCTLSFKGSLSASGAVIVVPGEGGAFEIRLGIESPYLWDDIEPNLYDLKISVFSEGKETDVTEKKVGIRKIEIDAVNGFRINGRKTVLRGGCIHHDNGALGSRALKRAEERKIRNLKAMGINAIRTAHNPPSDNLLDACDRYGIFVLDEFYDCWVIGKKKNDYHLWFEDWWERDITSTMKRDRNHPCVYCWSFGNEITETTGKKDGEYWVRVQSDLIRRLDPTRPVTCGGMFLPKSLTCDGFGNGPGGPPLAAGSYIAEEEQVRRYKAMIRHLDIVSLNYLYRNYEQFGKLFPGVPVQGTETMGMEAYANMKAVESNPHVIGDFMWTAHDNLGEAGAGRCVYEPVRIGEGGFDLMGDYPWLSCYQGDLALDGERLPRSYYRSVIWGLDGGVHLFSRHPSMTGKPVYGAGFQWHDAAPVWTFEKEYKGKPVEVEAYADCDEVEFSVNGVVKARSVPEEMIAYATVDYEPGILTATAYKDGKAVASDSIETTGPASSLALFADKKELEADGMDLCYVTIQLADKGGRPVRHEEKEVRVEVCGEGTLCGLGSNNPCTDENFGTGRRRTFRGKAMAIIRSAPESGTITVKVSCDGLPDAETVLKAR